ncbi:alpha/beta hydrolase [Bacillus niameyensis]|uniref:alpha/beta hydrolase n=1 Tax=Bacillus niameyensis TaxID=1522308 RepID=UPI00389943BE
MIILFIIFVILMTAYFIVGNYFYNFALNAHKEKDFLKENPHLVSADTEMLTDAEFSKYHQPEMVRVKSHDKLNLNGFFYENKKPHRKWAIVVHGYSGNSKQMLRYVRNFFEKGYHVLAPDLRGHGQSEGDYIGMGWHDRKDMLRWIDYIIEKDSNAEIVLFGISMGGATVMMTSGEQLPDNVKVIVEDCGYSSVMDVFTYQLYDLFHLPKFPVMNAANTITKIRAGYDLKEASAINQIAKSQTPILFIHGDADTFVPFAMLEEVYNAANVEKDKLIIPGAGHGEAEMVDPETYWNKVWKFVDKYILEEAHIKVANS